MAEVTFEFEVGDIVMVKPMAGSSVSYDVEIRNYQGGITADQYRITQRRYVEEINGHGRVGYSGQLVTDLTKNVTLPPDSIIKVDDYLAKKAILDSNKPKKMSSQVSTSNILRGQAAGVATGLAPSIKAFYQQAYASPEEIQLEMLKAQTEALKNSI